MNQARVRTCIGCLRKKSKEKLIRLVARKGKVITDLTGQAEGRGVYLCRKGNKPKPTCLDLAKKENGFKRIFKEKINSAANRRGFGSHRPRQNHPSR